MQHSSECTHMTVVHDSKDIAATEHSTYVYQSGSSSVWASANSSAAGSTASRAVDDDCSSLQKHKISISAPVSPETSKEDTDITCAVPSRLQSSNKVRLQGKVASTATSCSQQTLLTPHVPYGTIGDVLFQLCFHFVSCHAFQDDLADQDTNCEGCINVDYFGKTLLPLNSFSKAYGVDTTDNTLVAEDKVGVQASHSLLCLLLHHWNIPASGPHVALTSPHSLLLCAWRRWSCLQPSPAPAWRCRKTWCCPTQRCLVRSAASMAAPQDSHRPPAHGQGPSKAQAQRSLTT